MEKILLKQKKEWVIILIKYLKEKAQFIILGVIILIFINGYFLYLCGTRLYLSDLFYLDIILIVVGIALIIKGYMRYQQINKLLITQQVITTKQVNNYYQDQYLNILEKNNKYYQEEINHLSGQIQELSTYISRWAHEAKLPIASMRLMNERNKDLALKKEMRLTIERIQLLLNTMLMSSKLRNPENDIKIEKVLLAQVIKESIKHHSYFLINDYFTIDLEVGNEYVYSDRRWLTYMLDQFIANSIKYKRDNPKIHFFIEQEEQSLTLIIEDNGIGIAKEDIPYIFDRGFIGHNLRDGDYRSTGMGLYFVKDIASRLQIVVEVDETFIDGSRFKLKFINNAEYFLLDY
ncbi:sensor histidine kinase [Thomasclavelia sp.]|uniref:sensor histidine kinase n=1 Tax=Thomasclavelia sp. TaxID=3025757 RepID=UPI0039A01720